MTIRLSYDQPDFEARFDDRLTLKREMDVDVDDAVAGIIAEVRARGFHLIEAGHQFVVICNQGPVRLLF